LARLGFCGVLCVDEFTDGSVFGGLNSLIGFSLSPVYHLYTG
jgi:hypothetical protein